MANKPTLILFWSYKGGQGRTWLNANIGLELAIQGARVLALDLDFKAPGLHYFYKPLTQIRPLPGEESKRADFGFVDGLLRWFIAYKNSYKKRKRNDFFNPSSDFRDPEYFKQMIDEYRMPDGDHELFPAADWKQERYVGNPSAGYPKWQDDEPLNEGGFADLLTSFNLVKVIERREEIQAMKDDLTESVEPGALIMCPCGNISDEIFRDHFGSGYPWRILTDPRSKQAKNAPITFADAFYTAASYLAEVCRAEYVLVDLPAGVSNITEQLVDPIYWGKNAKKTRFLHGEPSGLIVVTSLAHQALDGTKALITGELLRDPVDPARGRLPLVIDEKRTMIAYNYYDPRYEHLREAIRKHAGETGIPRAFGGRIIPIGAFGPVGQTSMAEWLIPLNYEYYSYLELPRPLTEDEKLSFARMALHDWTDSKTGYVPRLRRRGAFWEDPQPEIEGIQAPSKLTIAVEDVAPSLNSFFENLTRRSIALEGLNKLDVYSFSSPALFKALPCSQTVREIRNQMGLEALPEDINIPLKSTVWDLKSKRRTDPTPKESSINDLLKKVDAITIPHFLLGYVHDLGTVDLDMVLGHKRRSHLEKVVEQFEELCCYRGAWCALPFSALAKIVYSREDLSSTRRSFVDLKNAINKTKQHTNEEWILTEAKSDSLSLWYEWEQILISSGVQLLDRLRGEDVGRVIPKGEKEKVLRVLKKYRELIDSQRTEHKGKIDWTDAKSTYVKNADYKVWLGWSDWAYDTIIKDGEAFKCLPLPLEDPDSPRQPLEAWVWVVPNLDGSHKEEHIKIAESLYLTMSSEWQREFQENGGGSAFRDVLNNSEIQRRQPWVSLVRDAMRNSIPKGKTPYTPDYAKATIAFLTYVLFGNSDNIDVADEKRIEERFNDKWEFFHKTLETIRDLERS